MTQQRSDTRVFRVRRRRTVAIKRYYCTFCIRLIVDPVRQNIM